MNLTVIILATILFFSSIISILAGLFLLFALKSFSDFESSFTSKYFTTPSDPNSKSYSFIHNYVYKKGRAAGLLLTVLGTYFLFLFVKIAIVL